MPDLLNDLMLLTTLTIGGTVAIGLFLKLATFNRLDITITCGFWLISSLIGMTLYLVVALSGIIAGGPTLGFFTNLIAGLLLMILLPSMEPNNKRIKAWSLYVPWVYFWFAGCVGWRSGWLGVLTITVPALLIAGGGLLFVAGFLIPSPPQDALYRGKRSAPQPGGVPMLKDQILDFLAMFRFRQNKAIRQEWIEHRRKALRCLITYTLGTNYPYYVVVDEKIMARTEDNRTWLTGEERLVKRAAGDTYGAFLSGPGLVLTGCDHAVAISSGLRFKGPKGPGVVFTGMSDTPTQAIDLRVQLRAFPVTAMTKDGIEVKFFAFIPFQMGAGGQRPALGRGYPYRASDVFRAFQAQVIDHKNPSQEPDQLEALKWYDLPQLAGERILQEIISRYNFDDLYAPFELFDNPGDDPRARIAKEFRDELDKVLPGWGIQRIGGGIGNIEPVNEQVLQKRIEAWQTEWVRQIMRKRAAGHHTRIQRVEWARAQAQTDVILEIGKRIAELRRSGEAPTFDRIVAQFLDLINQMAIRPMVQRYLPKDTRRVVRDAQRKTSNPA